MESLNLLSFLYCKTFVKIKETLNRVFYYFVDLKKQELRSKQNGNVGGAEKYNSTPFDEIANICPKLGIKRKFLNMK